MAEYTQDHTRDTFPVDRDDWKQDWKVMLWSFALFFALCWLVGLLTH